MSPVSAAVVPIRFLLFCLGLSLATSSAATPAPAKSPVAARPLPTVIEPRYYFSIDIDSRYQIVGIGALTPEDAAKANCYRFTTNQDGSLREVEYSLAGMPAPDPLLGAARVEFAYQPGLEHRSFTDGKGQPVSDVDGIQGEELTLNKAGFPTMVTNVDAAGGHLHDNSGVLRYMRTLDAANRLVDGHRIGLFGNAITDDNGFFETRTVYDEQGRAIQRSNYDAKGNLLADNDGVAVIRTTYTLTPDTTETTESYFDGSGLPTEEKSSGIHQRERTVDQRGLLLDDAYFDTSGAPSVTSDDGVHERRYTYDARGNKISESLFDVDGKLLSPKAIGFARVLYKYDNKNRIIEKAYFGDDGAPQIVLRVGAAIIRQEYDDQGNMVHRLFLDGQGHPSNNEIFGAPGLRIRVDGDTTYVALRNDEDKPAKNPIGGYYAFSYKTATDRPLSPTNNYYDSGGHELSYFPRVSVINPHLHALRTNHLMQKSARIGAAAAALGSLLACLMALRKSSYAKRRKIYVPTPMERLLGWFAILCIVEGSLRFFMTIYWAWVGYQNGQMGQGIYVLETLVILFFLYRLYRLHLTMRVLNTSRDDIHRIIHDFLVAAGLKPEWTGGSYVTPPLDVRLRYYGHKYHSYLAFHSRGPEGRKLAEKLADSIRSQAGTMQAPMRRRSIAFYYPIVAFCYLLLSGTGFYTLWQLVKGS